MLDGFNYEMSTQYQQEFKTHLTYQELYDAIDKENSYNLNSRDFFERRDSSGIFNKLKKLLHFDAKSFAVNDEEKYKLLKLMYFLI